MNSSQVKALIDEELRSGWDETDMFANPHGVELSRSLLAVPELRTYMVGRKFDLPVKCWLVLEEDPDGHSGYEIIYDEEEEEFGLAIDGDHIGIYGSFLDTLAAM